MGRADSEGRSTMATPLRREARAQDREMMQVVPHGAEVRESSADSDAGMQSGGGGGGGGEGVGGGMRARDAASSGVAAATAAAAGAGIGVLAAALTAAGVDGDRTGTGHGGLATRREGRVSGAVASSRDASGRDDIAGGASPQERLARGAGERRHGDERRGDRGRGRAVELTDQRVLRLLEGAEVSVDEGGGVASAQKSDSLEADNEGTSTHAERFSGGPGGALEPADFDTHARASAEPGPQAQAGPRLLPGDARLSPASTAETNSGSTCHSESPFPSPRRDEALNPDRGGDHGTSSRHGGGIRGPQGGGGGGGGVSGARALHLVGRSTGRQVPSVPLFLAPFPPALEGGRGTVLGQEERTGMEGGEEWRGRDGREGETGKEEKGKEGRGWKGR